MNYSTARESSPNREAALFSTALEWPAGERAAYLDEACADDGYNCASVGFDVNPISLKRIVT